MAAQARPLRERLAVSDARGKTAKIQAVIPKMRGLQFRDGARMNGPPACVHFIE